ncbi:MAG: adenylyltransferase/cytidyltransferase family protein [Gemmataceae bacterium]
MMNKILSESELVAVRAEHRVAGRTVVWTNGCFDLLHPGHIQSLQMARALGERLIVGLNSDASVRSNKGPARPILTQTERATMLAALACVDHVIIFDDATPSRLLALLQPDIHCKGAEYAPPHGRPVPEASIVEGYGGRLAFLPLVPGISTTELLQRIHAAERRTQHHAA